MLESEQLLTRQPAPPAVFNDPALRARVLSVYFDNARYLETADIGVDNSEGKEEVVSNGILSVPESCYIESTGHFNSVEFNICYNQIMYDAIAHASKYGLASYFADWGVEGFFSRQLPDILITRFHSRFSKPLDASRFHGEFVIRSARLHRTAQPFLFLKTSCRFFDDAGGDAAGEVDLAILNP
ncbi:FcoT family thioesterase [Chromobacterium vaccinii]|uniref:FcoT family thioesterase n=1 Tax=Chromobacterium TaxID=535 RepID=UPI0018F24DA7|nr:FcoT family thioesterase [Chromobacterium sp. ATCC 53434]